MLILVMGQNSSGKSAFAEALAVQLRQKRYYIATMLPYGEEGTARVQKHRAERAGQGFITLELPYSVSGWDIPADAVALVEDVSNLLSNAMFNRGVSALEVLEDIKLLSRRVDCIIAVTISKFDDGDYNEETRHYIQTLEWLNHSLHILADTVVEMQEGQPILRKGAWHELA